MQSTSSDISLVGASGALRDGNTSVPKRGRGPCTKYWVGTLFPNKLLGASYYGSHIDRIFESISSGHNFAKAVFQLETCPDTKRLHVQIYVELRVKERLTYLQAWSNSLQYLCHWEKRKGSAKEAISYCSKRETRLENTTPLFYKCQPPRDIDALLQLRYHHPLRDWQQSLYEIVLSKEVDDRVIHVIIDSVGGNGKSWFAGHMLWRHTTAVKVFTNARSADIVTAIDEDTQIVIIDLPRSTTLHELFPAVAIEQIKNGIITQGKLLKHAKTTLFIPPHVVVFTNHRPDTASLSSDRWQLYNITEETLDSFK